MIIIALVMQLVKTGVLSANDIEAMCRHLPDDDAHELRCAFIEAVIPPEPFTSIDGGKRG